MTYEEPNSIAFARSPILFAVYDALYTNTDFQYTCDVYVWQHSGSNPDSTKPASPNYELAKYPSPNGTATFNIQHLVSDFLRTKQYTFSNENDTYEMYCYVAVDLNYTYGTTTGTAIELDTFVVLDGYNYYMDGVNYLTDTNLGINASSGYVSRVLSDSGECEATTCIPSALLSLTGQGYHMTDRPLSMYMPTGTSMRQYVYNDSTSLVYKTVLTVNGEETVEYINSGYTNQIASIRVGSSEVQSLMTAVGYTTEIEYYTLQGFDSDDVPITQKYTFTIQEPCKYGFKNMQFLNRYGVWDNVILYGTERETLEVEREDIFKSILSTSTSPAMSYDTQRGQFGMFTGTGREMVTVNTGWISEDWNEVLKQMMMSEHLYDADSLQPYTIVTDSLQIRTSLNDKLSNYTFELKKANTFINTVM